jgi:hypothetical protein
MEKCYEISISLNMHDMIQYVVLLTTYYSVLAKVKTTIPSLAQVPSAAILAILQHDYKPTNIIANTVLLGVFTYTQRLRNRNFKYVKARGNMYVDTKRSLFYLTATTFHFLSTHLLYEHGPLNQVSIYIYI